MPVREAVKGACEVLGLDPLYVANEGKLAGHRLRQEMAARRCFGKCSSMPLGTGCRRSSEKWSPSHPGMVRMKTQIGGTRILDVMFGEQLPRIC